ncbi:MAG: corrinoid protein [Candidatus Bathyarchaeota archaeon]
MKEEHVNKLMNAVVNYDVDGAVKFAEEALQAGVDPVEAIQEGLAKGVRVVGDRFAAGEAFLTELVIAAEAMKQAKVILERAIPKGKKGAEKALGKIIIGTIEGDIHDIGKSIINTMLTVAGFEVVDLGVDVSVKKFIEKTREVKPDVIGMSALMTTTMLKMRDVIKALDEEGLRKKVKVIVGGAPTSREWAEEIGADGHGGDAMEAVEVAKKLVGTP